MYIWVHMYNNCKYISIYTLNCTVQINRYLLGLLQHVPIEFAGKLRPNNDNAVKLNSYDYINIVQETLDSWY